jgi:hypothetical protein
VLEAGWVDPHALETLPRVRARPERIVYGPLAALSLDPDVVLLRIVGAALMTLRNALPGLRIEGKPQCHIVAIAAEGGEPAVSVGCALSRARTGMPPEEMTCTLPAEGLAEVVARIEAAAELDRAMHRYASADAKRFSERERPELAKRVALNGPFAVARPPADSPPPRAPTLHASARADIASGPR